MSTSTFIPRRAGEEVKNPDLPGEPQIEVPSTRSPLKRYFNNDSISQSETMSDRTDEEGGVLSDENTYNGKIYWLGQANSPDDGEYTLDGLREFLNDREIHFDISNKLRNREDLFIPEVFTSSGTEIETVTTIENVTYAKKDSFETVVGKAVIDEPNTVHFRKQDILVLDTVEVRFSIFKVQGIFFLVMLGKRSLVDNVKDIIEQELSTFGLAPSEVTISHHGFEEIRESVASELLDTTFEEYSQSSIDKKRIWGRGYEDEQEYENEKRKGKIHGHMMVTERMVDGREIVVGISDDCLVRSYHSVPLSNYLEFLVQNVIPSVSLPWSTQSLLSSYGFGAQKGD
jgi:hypothetical protein